LNYSVYPNPADRYFVVEGKGPAGFSMIFNVFDLTGRLVCSPELAASGITTIFTDHWPDGLYFYEVILNGCKSYGKLLVHH
jgi:hypothetical protein